MLKGNLSTRPFYNERLVNLLLLLAAAAGIALALFNVTRIMQLSSERVTRVAAERAAEAEAARIRVAAEREKGSVDTVRLRELAGYTTEANELIDQRLFSWTVFFGLIQKTLPLDARLVAVSPRVQRGVFQIVMTVNAKRLDDLEAFKKALEDTGSFYDVLPTSQDHVDDGTWSATVISSYLAPSAAPTKAAAPAGRPERP